jgi:CHASE3 domain sensor protein
MEKEHIEFLKHWKAELQEENNEFQKKVEELQKKIEDDKQEKKRLTWKEDILKSALHYYQYASSDSSMQNFKEFIKFDEITDKLRTINTDELELKEGEINEKLSYNRKLIEIINGRIP